ncbi:hypothetical protein PPTG_09395 [Phytophthora nicotianae INRA-310]|uniref:Uncharacterized protein n=1 Tax=Phytophthora nicotianae (strain INRA-310) TaxID=761204 RepID=W2QET5_PHYN3|nr:hypothetical protein PPTG_09395 [Phytophthora nicotianae INRA-310]ETN11682.1 hypothetical protein PPTG_09395 [Phytophthora nicotianae INRA-310]
MVRRTSSRPGWAMERYVAAVCACLEGDVNLWPREVPRFESSDELLPVPWITVLFRAETKSNAGNTRNPSVHHNTNTTPSNANANDYHGSVDRNEALTRQVHDKVAAIRFLSLVARYPEYSWRGNPLFWKHVLNDICDSSSCNVYFPPPQSSSFRRREKPPNCAPARNAVVLRICVCVLRCIAVWSASDNEPDETKLEFQ